jgi:stage V sporulation protein G
MNEISISEVQVIPVKPKNGLVAFASCIINNQFYFGNIAIYSSLSVSEGFRLVYPTKTLKNGTQLSLIYPINRETGSIIQRCLVEEYLKLVENLTKGDVLNERNSTDA